MTCCHGDCNQGRDCVPSQIATCNALGLGPAISRELARTLLLDLQREIADEAARSDVECMAQGVARYHDCMPMYDLGALSSELPRDDDMQQDYRAALDKAVRYLDLRGLLVRPDEKAPELVCFRRGAA